MFYTQEFRHNMRTALFKRLLQEIKANTYLTSIPEVLWEDSFETGKMTHVSLMGLMVLMCDELSIYFSVEYPDLKQTTFKTLCSGITRSPQCALISLENKNMTIDIGREFKDRDKHESALAYIFGMTRVELDLLNWIEVTTTPIDGMRVMAETYLKTTYGEHVRTDLSLTDIDIIKGDEQWN